MALIDIAEVARRVGLTVGNLRVRRYRGLVTDPPAEERLMSGQRVYDDKNIRQWAKENDLPYDPS